MSIDLETHLRTSFRALTDALPASPPPPAPRLSAAPVRHPTRRIVVAGLAVAAAGTAVAVVVGNPVAVPPAQAAARTALRRAARHAAAAPFSVPRVDQYLYVRSVGQSLASRNLPGGDLVIFLSPEVDQVWQAVDPARPGLQRQSGGGAPTFLRPGDEQRLGQAGLLDALDIPDTPQEMTIPAYFSGNRFTTPSWPFLAGLPTDPDGLYQQIEAFARGHGPSLHEEMLVTISDALNYSTAPPAVVAALYEVAARVPGVELVPGAVDVSGRRGVAVALASYWTRRELIFDETTGTFLGSREFFAHAQLGYPAGTLVTSQATTVTVVDAIGQTSATYPSSDRRSTTG